MEYREITTVGDLLVRGAVQHPDRQAIVMPEGRATYAELLDRATGLARSLVALGIERGDRLGILMPNCLAFLEVELAASLIGAVTVPINSRFRSTELRHVIPNAGVRLVFVSDLVEDAVSYIDRIAESFPDLAEQASGASVDDRLHLEVAPELEHVVVMGRRQAPGFTTQEAFERAGEQVDTAEVHRRRDGVALRDQAVIFYTSGTTSLPKGCALSHEAMVRQGIITADRLGMREADVVFSPLPMFHTGCTQVLLAVLHRMGTYVSMTHFDADEALAMIEAEEATILFPAFSAITDGLMNAPGYTEDSFRRARVLFHIATPDQLRLLQDRLPHTSVVTGFGMTEFAGSLAIGDPAEELERRVLPGRPLAGAELQIRDPEDGRVLPPGTEGEIVARGPTMFSGYHGDPDRTAEVTTPDGWYRTGDLGTLNEHGELRFNGRLKDMLKIGGENVGAVEIESYLEAHPAVALAQVVGLPDERLGEVAVAFLQLKDGAEATEEDIQAHCRGEIASFKVPRHVRFVSEWPMSATKVKKGELRERVYAEFGIEVA